MAPDVQPHDQGPRSSGSAARFFARLSQEMMAHPQEAPTLQTLVGRAVEVVVPCSSAAISLRRRHHHLETVAATDELSIRCDQIQYALDEGPCVDAALLEDWYLSSDLRDEHRWPNWAPRAVQEGVRSVLSIRLTTATEALGALNLYSCDHDAWTADDVDHALVYAAHAANALSSARLADGLQVALQGRHTIGIAQGMLMLRYDLTQEQSFEVLRRLSSQHNIKLRDLAASIVENQGLPAGLLDEVSDP